MNVMRKIVSILGNVRRKGRIGGFVDSALYAIKRGSAALLDDEAFVKIYYRLHTGRRLDLRDPVTYSEKLQWLKLYYRPPVMVSLVDKYSVREYVASRVGAEYLIPLLGVYDSPDAIELDGLPESFVLKPTHGSGWVILCRNKSEVDWPSVESRLRIWLKRNYYYHAREWAYRHVPPRIVCEALLEDEAGRIPMDFKVFCFGGVPEMIQVDVDRFGDHRRDFYDTSWNRLPVELKYPASGRTLPRPSQLDRMLEVASALAAPFPVCRVDLYCVGSKVYFGELTFFPGNGVQSVRPVEYEFLWGEKIKLPNVRTL